jgi:hypothetical protein
MPIEKIAILRSARTTIEAWRSDYNTERPHSSLDYRTPNEFAVLLARTEEQNSIGTLPVAGELIFEADFMAVAET